MITNGVATTMPSSDSKSLRFAFFMVLVLPSGLLAVRRLALDDWLLYNSRAMNERSRNPRVSVLFEIYRESLCRPALTTMSNGTTAIFVDLDERVRSANEIWLSLPVDSNAVCFAQGRRGLMIAD